MYPSEDYTEHISSVKNAENIHTPPEHYKTINEKLEGKRHEKTGVLFVRKTITGNNKNYDVEILGYDVDYAHREHYKRYGIQYMILGGNAKNE